jgi:hypothetical protein
MIGTSVAKARAGMVRAMH